jgi:putative spermidine/putrescine transport system substrate-binding protein
VRTPGGAYEEAWRKAAWERFAEETGIQIVPIAANLAKVLAMVESGNIELDVLDIGEIGALQLAQKGALEKLDTSRFALTNLGDVEPVKEYYLGNNYYATILAYNTNTFPDKHPTTWAEFWDVKAFPGPRMLQDLAAAQPDLEFALLADGVPMDQLYPLDVDRAFKKLTEIRPHITKWWDSGAVAAQMLADKQVVLGSVWNGRVQVLIDGGAPLAIEWNQGTLNLQAFCILKGAPNLENAYKYIDFVLQPEIQAAFAKNIAYGPANRKAFEYIDEVTAAKLPTSPEHLGMMFVNNAQWWLENRDMVAERWQEFLLGG